jgi:hypothetical protein
MARQIAFLDTEFTDLVHNPELLSLGLVTLDGREHYVELDLTTPEGLARRRGAGAFAKHGPVLEQWGRVPSAACSYLEMGARTAAWLRERAAAAGGRIEVAYDYAMDWELFEYLLRDAGEWEWMRDILVPVDIDHVVARIEGELAAEAAFERIARERDLRRHHALADAWALRAAYARERHLPY